MGDWLRMGVDGLTGAYGAMAACKVPCPACPWSKGYPSRTHVRGACSGPSAARSARAGESVRGRTVREGGREGVSAGSAARLADISRQQGQPRWAQAGGRCSWRAGPHTLHVTSRVARMCCARAGRGRERHHVGVTDAGQGRYQVREAIVQTWPAVLGVMEVGWAMTPSHWEERPTRLSRALFCILN